MVKNTSIDGPEIKDDEKRENYMLPTPESPVKQRRSENQLPSTFNSFTQEDSPVKEPLQDLEGIDTSTTDFLFLRNNTAKDENALDNSGYSDISDFQDDLTGNPIIDDKSSINNQFLYQEYVTMTSKNIQSISNVENKSKFFQSTGTKDSLSEKFLTKTQYLVFYLEFNYFNLIKQGKDILCGIYPEINLIVVIELDDDERTQQKIALIRSDDKNKYLPMTNQQDMTKKTGYRLLRFVNYSENNHKNSHKLKIQMCTYSNDQLSIISQEEIYFETNTSLEMHKFQFYNNMYNSVMKKIGNIFLSFTYKLESLKMSLEDNEEYQKQYFGLFSVNYLNINYINYKYLFLTIYLE